MDSRSRHPGRCSCGHGRRHRRRRLGGLHARQRAGCGADHAASGTGVEVVRCGRQVRRRRHLNGGGHRRGLHHLAADGRGVRHRSPAPGGQAKGCRQQTGVQRQRHRHDFPHRVATTHYGRTTFHVMARTHGHEANTPRPTPDSDRSNWARRAPSHQPDRGRIQIRQRSASRPGTCRCSTWNTCRCLAWTPSAA